MKFPSFLRGGKVPKLATERTGPGCANGTTLNNVTTEQRSFVFAATAIALSYPDDNFNDAIDAIDAGIDDLPGPIAFELRRFTDWTKLVGKRFVEQTYVETFDQKRRCALELTYYATGDTRQRGIALTVFSDLYAALGWQLDNKELPDFLPNLLELAARAEGDDVALVNKVIATHREGVEILHAALNSISSPWVNVLAALRMVLPEVDEATAERLNRLIRQGPPQELVGAQSTLLPWPNLAPTTSQPTPVGVGVDMNLPLATSPAPGATRIG